MGREKTGYRDNLELLNVRYPDKDMLSITEIMAVTGFRSRATVRKHFGNKLAGGKLSKPHLAYWMCG